MATLQQLPVLPAYVGLEAFHRDGNEFGFGETTKVGKWREGERGKRVWKYREVGRKAPKQKKFHVVNIRTESNSR